MYGELDTSETGSLQVEISEKCALCDDTVSRVCFSFLRDCFKIPFLMELINL